MLVLLGIGLLAGLVTAISPCVLPVLPILLAGGASGRRPLRIVAGLAGSFVVFTLFGSWLLDALGLPQDLLRNLAIALLLVVAATLLLPPLGALLERPFARLTRFRAGGGGFLLGVSLGLVFVPCAGPVLAAITVVAATHDVGWRAVLLTVAYATGAAVPMLLIALGGRGVAARLRRQAARLRVASGLVIGLVALAIALDADARFQTAVPGYTAAIQEHVESSQVARRELAKLRGAPAPPERAEPGLLQRFGRAPDFRPDGRWFNSKPLTISALRGKVVLVDFWTYSCINCLRTLPHLEAWYRAYRGDGLEIVGVHTPEFAFEHVASNVASAIGRLGIEYPVVQDNRYRTWAAYSNQYWPAEYLIDRNGQVRHVHFGEGSYGETERAIRALLGRTGRGTTRVADTTPREPTTPESYLGYRRLERYAGTRVVPDRAATYRLPGSLPAHELAYGGTWRVESERIVAGPGARLRLHFRARRVYLVLGGKGRVGVSVAGRRLPAVSVDAYRLYALVRTQRPEEAVLDLSFTPGIRAYAFTFG
ncbi:MAG TPA: cytochrome c biogenesis protein DipZ [Gaiellaceae bacterium]|nr:cytochrome c biogenesis protein DipZ [Gaiellaceae bacterium]